MNALAFIPILGKLIERIFPDPAQRDKAKLALLEMQQKGELNEFEAASKVIVAEANSEHWLTSTWRPILMLSFTAIIVNNYILSPYIQLIFGTSVHLEIPPDMWALLKLGVGGYIVGRSVERSVHHYSEAKKPKSQGGVDDFGSDLSA